MGPFSLKESFWYGLSVVVISGWAVCVLAPRTVFAETLKNDDCMACHADADSAPFVDIEKFQQSVHGSDLCTSCHTDVTEVPHEEKLKKVDCGSCHDKAQTEFLDSLHGKALLAGDPLAPRCASCHGAHDILPSGDSRSRVFFPRIPYVCGSCHSEGKPVMVQREIHESNIIENYTESIHGEGLFKQGLSVTATCVSCHRAHNILAHTDPRSSIARDNIAQTCQKCHGQIEAVHRKVIEGELWEKNPQSIPICVDCHQPHQIRKVFYNQGVADHDCLSCHGKTDLVSSKDQRSLYVNEEEVKLSAHAKVACSQCHSEVQVSEQRACATITQKVNCAVCHSEQVEHFGQSIHGKLLAEKNSDAPSCMECHGIHGIRSKKDKESPTYPMNVPALCSRCHQEHQRATLKYQGSEHAILDHYMESIHGKGLLKSGLTVTAMCTDCHTAHRELPAQDPASSVNRDNIALTCAKCHHGVYEKYKKSIHAPGPKDDASKFPVCSDCHTAHTIKRTDVDQFNFEIMNTCGKCHGEIADTYFQTFHGKVTKLGYLKTAKCHDCHGSHEILPTSNPQSTLSRENIVATCQKCHPGATRQFAGYLTHATHHDPKKYPWIFWTFWIMTGLLVVTFVLSGLHALLWLPRSLQMRQKHPPEESASGEKQYVRFPLPYRLMHAVMIVSFLTLAITGMALKFSYTQWAMVISKILGGSPGMSLIHRFAAVLMFGLFIAHIVYLLWRKKQESKSWGEMLFGPNTMLFTMKDIREFFQSLRWYAGRGPRPHYGRWTYWEKFDYFAVFWGIMVIGTSGLILWFPEFFTRFLPGWAINVATIIHSDEALLAAGFIFTIHFFNTHFRPEKFPMDKVIFTGRMSLEELKRERPAEYEALMAKKELEKHLADPLPPKKVRIMVILAWCALFVGISLIIGIIYAMIFVYK